MTDKVGKIDLAVFKDFILKRLGHPDRTVIVPPMTGVDAGVVDLEDGRVLVIAEDPIFVVPGQPLEMFGWYTVHIGASDVAVMGVAPRYMTYSLLMPPGTPDKDLRTIVDTIHREAKALGIAIVGGHTGYYPGLASPLIGGITVFSVCGKDEFVTPAGARPGDDVLITKGPAIEAVGILSVLREKELLTHYPKELVDRAKATCMQMTVVKDAIVAMRAGGVTAMHDATEGGVIGGLFEIANASGVGMEVDESRFVYPEEVKMVAEALRFDAIAAIAEGTLLLTVRPTHSKRVIKALARKDIRCSVVGKVLKDKRRRTVRRLDGKVEKLYIPEQDPFWPIFFESLAPQG